MDNSFLKKAAEMARKLWEKQAKAREKKKLKRDAKIRLTDLEIKMHQVGDVRLPFPSLYALQWLEIYFAPLDELDVNNLNHFGAIVFILETQNNVDELALMGKEAIDAAISRQLSEISTAEHYKYILCISEMMDAIKKNYNKGAIQILEQQKAFLENLLHSSPDGQ